MDGLAQAVVPGLIVDNFAGGGGASLGLEWALGRSPDIAINHDAEAVAMHKANHPNTRHYCQDVWKVDPRIVCEGQPVAVAWFSPDCKHHSKAKGGKPVDKKVRDLAWVVVRWAKAVRPAVIMLENVEEFRDWGPLIEIEGGKMRPCPLRKGLTYRRWKKALLDLGYVVEERERRACDAGAPTIRKRLYVIARCDGRPIMWPAPTHAQFPTPALKAWRTAADCLDFSLPCPSIFNRKKDLAENTMRRIARGVFKFVVNHPKPFIVGAGGPTYSGKPVSTARPFGALTTENHRALVTPFVAPVTHQGDARVYDVQEPMRSVTGAHRGEFALIAPSLIQTGYGEREGQAPRCLDLGRPLGTVVGGGAKHAMVAAHLTKFRGGATGCEIDVPMPTVTANSYIKRPGGAPPIGLVAAFLAKHYGGHETPGAPVDKSFDTITARDHHALVAAHILNLKGNDRRHRQMELPLPTVTSGGFHLAEVRAFLIKYYGTATGVALGEPMHTVTVDDRFALVMVEGEPHVIYDIGMRMLQPRELYRAQGFPDSYIINPWMDDRVGRKGQKLKPGPLPAEGQVRMAGNSVSPYEPKALATANCIDVGIDIVAARAGLRMAA